jgi:hypothetical protein
VTELLASLGQKVATRWLEAVLLPGLTYIAVVAWALLAGQRHPFDPTYLGEQLDRWWSAHTGRTGTVIVATVGLLAAASVAGTAIAAFSSRIVQRWWGMDRFRSPGGRVHRAGRRVAAQYGFDLTAAWTPIWLLADAGSREIVSAAARRYHAASDLSAWGALLLPWTLRCWPVGVIAVVALGAARILGRERAALFASVVESTVDLYAGRLAQTLGVAVPEGRVDPHRAGPLINLILQKVDDDH